MIEHFAEAAGGSFAHSQGSLLDALGLLVEVERSNGPEDALAGNLVHAACDLLVELPRLMGRIAEQGFNKSIIVRRGKTTDQVPRPPEKMAIPPVEAVVRNVPGKLAGPPTGVREGKNGVHGVKSQPTPEPLILVDSDRVLAIEQELQAPADLDPGVHPFQVRSLAVDVARPQHLRGS